MEKFNWDRGEPIYTSLMLALNEHKTTGKEYSHADFLGAAARIVATIVKTIEREHPGNKTIGDDAKRFISEMIDDPSIVPVTEN